METVCGNCGVNWVEGHTVMDCMKVWRARALSEKRAVLLPVQRESVVTAPMDFVGLLAAKGYSFTVQCVAPEKRALDMAKIFKPRSYKKKKKAKPVTKKKVKRNAR